MYDGQQAAFAAANYEMTFDNGHFSKNKKYIIKEKKGEKVIIISDEGKEQDFYLKDFETLFTIL